MSATVTATRPASSGVTRATTVTPIHVRVAFEIQSGLARLKDDDSCTDFEVVVEGRSFRCHKAVLAAVSDYFLAMFQSNMKETMTNKTTLTDVSIETFQLILDILYFKNSAAVHPLVNRSDGLMSEMLRVADMFQMKFLSKVCLKMFTVTMSAKNCIGRWKLGRTIRNEDLCKLAWSHMNDNFDKVVKEGNVLSLDYEDVLAIISNEYLRVDNEISVWQLISAWADFDGTKRAEKVPELLKSCCLTEITASVLMEHIAFDERIHLDKDAYRLVQTAIKFQNHLGDHGNMDLKFRYCMGKEQIRMLLGVADGQETLSMLCYSSRDERWKDRTIPYLRVAEFASCVHGRDVYLTGGTGANGDRMHKYSGESDAWVMCSGKMPHPLRRHSMVASDTNLYALGGRTGAGLGTLSSAVLGYNIASAKWNFYGILLAPVEHASAVYAHDKIYVIGGVLKNSEPIMASDSIQMYDVNAKVTTILKTHLPSPSAFSCAVTRLDCVYVVSGNGEVVRLSARTMEPHLVATIPEFKGRTGFGVTMKGDILTVYGGVVKKDGASKTISSDATLIDVGCGKVTSLTALFKRYTFYGALNVVVKSDMFDEKG